MPSRDEMISLLGDVVLTFSISSSTPAKYKGSHNYGHQYIDSFRHQDSKTL